MPISAVTGLTSSAINLVTTPATNASHARPAVMLLLGAAYIAWNTRTVASSPNTAKLTMPGVAQWANEIVKEPIQEGIKRYSVHQIEPSTFSGGTISGKYEGCVLKIEGLSAGVWAETESYFFPWASIEALTAFSVTGSAI